MEGTSKTIWSWIPAVKRWEMTEILTKNELFFLTSTASDKTLFSMSFFLRILIFFWVKSLITSYARLFFCLSLWWDKAQRSLGPELESVCLKIIWRVWNTRQNQCLSLFLFASICCCSYHTSAPSSGPELKWIWRHLREITISYWSLEYVTHGVTLMSRLRQLSTLLRA